MSLDQEKCRCTKLIAKQVAFVAAGQINAADAIDNLCDITDDFLDKLSVAIDMLRACKLYMAGGHPALEADIIRFINELEDN